MSNKDTSNTSTTDTMAALRVEIDRVDTTLLNLIAERMELAAAVRKAKSGTNVWRPSREESLVRDLARKAGVTSPDLVSHIWAELVSASLTLQGPIGLHIALVGDALSQWTLVRDRFGASIPTYTYPTASAALAAAQADLEGVAVLPAPGGMNNWWTVLGSGGAMENMHILAALPRIGNWGGNKITGGWPIAVAVSKADMEPSGDDMTLIDIEINNTNPKTVFATQDLNAVIRAEMNDRYLISVQGFLKQDDPRLQTLAKTATKLRIVGVLPNPIPNPAQKSETGQST